MRFVNAVKRNSVGRSRVNRITKSARKKKQNKTKTLNCVPKEIIINQAEVNTISREKNPAMCPFLPMDGSSLGEVN